MIFYLEDEALEITSIDTVGCALDECAHVWTNRWDADNLLPVSVKTIVIDGMDLVDNLVNDRFRWLFVAIPSDTLH